MLHCAVKNEISLGNRREKLNLKFSPEVRVVLSVLLDLFLRQVPNHTSIPVQRSNQLS